MLYADSVFLSQKNRIYSGGVIPVVPFVAGVFEKQSKKIKRIIKWGAGVVAYTPFIEYTKKEYLIQKGSVARAVIFGKTWEERASELLDIKEKITAHQDMFSNIWIDCSYVMLGIEDAQSIAKWVEEYKKIGYPIGVVVSVLSVPKDIAQMAQMAEISQVVVAEQVPADSLSSEAQKIFFRGSDLSVLGYGYVSGKYTVPLVGEWVHRFKSYDKSTQVIAGGGIRARDIEAYKESKADGIFLGSIGIVRPWNVPQVLRRMHKEV